LTQAQQQSGIAARLTAVNGKEFPVFLQGLEGDKVIFQLYKRPQNQAAPLKAIDEIEFLAQFDKPGIEQLYSTGDYQGMILKMKAELKPSLDGYWDFMTVENNLQDLFTMLMKAYLRSGDIASANKAAAILLQNKDKTVQGQAESIALLAALGEDRIADAEALLAGVESEPGKLYLGACIERAKGQTAAAFMLTNRLIREFGNDLGWMPQAELLNAHLYVDSGLTNSAINTARQVMNIYRNSDVGNDAGKLHSELVLVKTRYEADVKAREDAEAAAAVERRARAAERAKGFGFSTDTEGNENNMDSDQDGSDGEEQAEEVAEENVEL
jgi:hypothetical protein